MNITKQIYIKINILFIYPNLELNMHKKDINLKDVLILFDRDWGISIFHNFRGYNNLIDDVEWLLERTTQKSRGFFIRPIKDNKNIGVWIGGYDYKGNNINKQDFLFGEKASAFSKIISDYIEHKISKKIS